MTSRRGVALVLVLWVLVILGAVAAAVVDQTRTSTAAAGNARAHVVARYAAESGIEATASAIEDSLAVLADTVLRASFLNGLEPRSASDTTALGRGRFQVGIIDASARLDVNAATEEMLARFFSRFTDLARAAAAARGIRAWIERRSDGAVDARLMPDASGAVRAIRPLSSLEEVRRLRLLDDATWNLAAPYLTVDGDGTINRTAASSEVLSVAGGELHDEPSRLVIVSRGWEAGHPYTHEVQAVYAITGRHLVLVQWRERSL